MADLPTESYRDRVSTIDASGKRQWIYPRKPSGSLHRARIAVGIILLAILFITPFLRWHGRPVMLFNITEQNFILFGMGFWPQDFYLFGLATIALVVFIVLFTAVFGRLWCGWACPQTVFMELVFRKIEYLIEGGAQQQRQLNASPMNPSKFFKKSLKHGIFFGVSFLIGNLLLSYIIGTESLFQIITDPPSQHLSGLIAMIAFSLVFYWIFAFFREQACVMVCPYARLQGVLIDPNSIVVAYDFKRGEPRTKPSLKERRQNDGDCIDCGQCVEVCPTGIDIRNGTQLECINCAACIDACNSVMRKIRRPSGLIRYTSFNGVLLGQKLRVTPRIIGYSVVLALILGVLIALFVKRQPVDITVLRTPGILYQEREDGAVMNLYNLTVINKTFTAKAVDVKMVAPQGEVNIIGGEMMVAGGQTLERSFFLILPKDKLKAANTPVTLQIFSGADLIREVRSSFIAPLKSGT
jgi:cytochrome c oxidase accessory protein FixG